MKDLLAELVQLADQLDGIGSIKMANEIDGISKKVKGALQGFITDKDLDEAEKSFPGINRYYNELRDKPGTFLNLLFDFLKASGDMPAPAQAAGDIISEAVYSDDPSDPQGRAIFFVDRAISRLKGAEENVLNAATIMPDELYTSIYREIAGARNKLEDWLASADPESSNLRVLEGSFKNAELQKVAVIRRMKGKWCVLSKKGKKLGCYATKKEAQKRLRQIEYFKHNK